LESASDRWQSLINAAGIDHPGWQVVAYNSGWMIFNTILAWIPWVCAGIACDDSSRSRKQRAAWLLVAVAFLPNAPYVVSDLLHIRDDYDEAGHAFTAMIVAPTYALFIISGLVAYLLTFRYFEHILHRHVRPLAMWSVLIALHAAVAIGIWLGRVDRLNSWEFVTNPLHVLEKVADLFANPRALGTVAITFLWLVAIHLGGRAFAKWMSVGGIGTRDADHPHATAG
jgi:uncharacterized membrane protein